MENSELTHWGIKGMKWGVRRYQNKDGSLTAAGKKRYSDQTNYYKNKHSSERYKNEARQYIDELTEMQKIGYKKWADKNYMSDLSDKLQKKEYDNYASELRRSADSAIFWSKESKILNSKIDSIDPTSIGYKSAMKLVKQTETQWIVETIEKENRVRKR